MSTAALPVEHRTAAPSRGPVRAPRAPVPALAGMRNPHAGPAWLPWEVVDRENGTWAVRRESGSGKQLEWVCNEVRRPKVFRREYLAVAARDKANAAATAAHEAQAQ